MDCSPPGSSVHGILHARILEWVAISSPWDLPNRETVPGSPALKADSLPSELPGKPNRGVSIQSQNPSQSVGDCGAGSEPRDEGLMFSKT